MHVCRKEVSVRRTLFLPLLFLFICNAQSTSLLEGSVPPLGTVGHEAVRHYSVP